MSCKEFEQRIYVYRELAVDERKLVDAHLQSCASCAAMFAEIKGTLQPVEQVSIEKAVPLNAARLTRSIMSKIASDKITRSSIFTELLWGRARLVLTGLSIVLLVSFAVEFLEDAAQFKAAQNLVVNNSVVLNSKAFRDNFLQDRVKHSLFADCGTPLKKGQSYLDCLRNKLR